MCHDMTQTARAHTHVSNNLIFFILFFPRCLCLSSFLPFYLSLSHTHTLSIEIHTKQTNSQGEQHRECSSEKAGLLDWCQGSLLK